MAMFNSYVSLPEGTIPSLSAFLLMNGVNHLISRENGIGFPTYLATIDS